MKTHRPRYQLPGIVIPFPCPNSDKTSPVYSSNRPFIALERVMRDYELREDFRSCGSPIWSDAVMAFFAMAVVRCQGKGIDPVQAVTDLVKLPLSALLGPSAIANSFLPIDDQVREIVDVGMAAVNRCAWLKAWRKRNGLTQGEAASLLGYTSRRQIGQIETGYKLPGWQKILRAAEYDKHRQT